MKIKTLEEKLRLGKPETRILNILLKARRPMDTYEITREYFKDAKRPTKYPHVYIATVSRRLVYKTRNNPESEFIVIRGEQNGSIPVKMWIEKRRKV